MIKNVTFTLILLSILLTGCSANSNTVQKTQHPTKSVQKAQQKRQPQKSTAEKKVLTRLKGLYSVQAYETLILSYNQLKMYDSKEINDLYNQAIQRLLNKKHYNTIKKLIDDDNYPIYLGSLSGKVLNEISANVESLTHGDHTKNFKKLTIEQAETANSSSSNSTNKTATNQETTPQIGMTADEVRATAWGEPAEINKTTTAGDVSEQWVYYNMITNVPDRFVYLDNGIVTAIQDEE